MANCVEAGTHHHLMRSQRAKVVASAICLLGIIAVGLELEERLRVGSLMHLMHGRFSQCILRRVHLVLWRWLWQKHRFRIRNLLHLRQQLGLLLYAAGRGETKQTKSYY